MVESFHLDLTPEQVQELEHTRDHHLKAYLRVKAAAILKVASGGSMRQIAQQGLLKPVDEATVSRWGKTSQQQGIAGPRRTRTQACFFSLWDSTTSRPNTRWKSFCIVVLTCVA